jgi:hypothetical protein
MQYFGSMQSYKAPVASFRRGGMVPTYSNMSAGQRSSDSVRAMLTPGELVIPVKGYGMKRGQMVKSVITYLHSRGVKLPNA